MVVDARRVDAARPSTDNYHAQSLSNFFSTNAHSSILSYTRVDEI